MNRAIDVAKAAKVDQFAVSSDIDWGAHERWFGDEPGYRYGLWILRPAALAQDETPMIDVVQHALEAIPGPDDQIVLLLQPTQPLREPKHLKAAIELLEQSGADSVVSVVDIGVRDAVLYVDQFGHLHPLWEYCSDEMGVGFSVPAARQGEPRSYKADGSVYAFRRATVARYGTIYGQDVRPLIIPREETCVLDEPGDWHEAERRLRARG